MPAAALADQEAGLAVLPTAAAKASPANTGSKAVKPNREDVVCAVVPGRVARLDLTDEQKRTLRDPEGQIALNVLRHFLPARVASVDPAEPPGEFPLVGHVIQAIAKRLGVQVGEKRADRLRARLVGARLLIGVGSYRPVYANRAGDGAHRVPLWKLGVRGIVGYVRTGLAAYRKAFVRTRGRVKPRPRRRWWQHGLFGNPGGVPPPNIPPGRLRQTRSLDELEWTWR